MAMARTANSADFSDIQRRMAQIRHEMHDEVRGAVRGAQSLTDWRSMVANHPWAALGVGGGSGLSDCSGSPIRAPTAMRLHIAAAVAAATRADAGAPRAEPAVAKASFVRAASSLLTPVVVRAAQNYALNQVEHWLVEHPFRFAETKRERPGEPKARRPGDEDSEGQTVRFRDRR